jgi:hypothetical protein
MSVTKGRESVSSSASKISNRRASLIRSKEDIALMSTVILHLENVRPVVVIPPASGLAYTSVPPDAQFSVLRRLRLCIKNERRPLAHL